MAATDKPSARTPFQQSGTGGTPTAAFLQQRDVLVGEISMAMEQVLQNINKLNRNLEGVIAVGNEFGAVEALWSQFENVMAEPSGEGEDQKTEANEGEEQGEEVDDETVQKEGKEGKPPMA
ncbi:MAG: hypothetical protein Q9183_004606 [Haloplaca sp. 2 TL-2023]